jgi:hypothetical protein
MTSVNLEPGRRTQSDTVRVVTKGNLSNVRERLKVCKGVRFDDPTSDAARYPVIRPIDDWRVVAPEEEDQVLGQWNASFNRGDYIGVFPVGDTVLEEVFRFFDWYFAGRGKSVAQCQEWMLKSPMLSNIYSRNGKESEVFFGLSRCAANQSVVTIDRDVNSHVGLHFDNFDRLQLPKRHLGRNRISVNVGSQSRYFLFAPFQAHAIYRSVTHSSPDMADLLLNEHRDLVVKFFEMNPQQKIYRLEIRPGEAYLAPTENIIHDGSSLGGEQPDYTLVWFGYFSLDGVIHA